MVSAELGSLAAMFNPWCPGKKKGIGGKPCVSWDVGCTAAIRSLAYPLGGLTEPLIVIQRIELDLDPLKSDR
jgi:hypothetical protein